MALPLSFVVYMDKTRSQYPGPSPTLRSLGPSHQQHHNFQVSLRIHFYAHGISGTPREEVRDIFLPPIKIDALIDAALCLF